MEDSETKENHNSDGHKPQDPSIAVDEMTSTQQDITEEKKEGDPTEDSTNTPGEETILPQDTELKQETKNETPKPQKTINAPLIFLVVIVTALFTAVAVCGAILLAQNNNTGQGNDVPVASDTNIEPELGDFDFDFIKLENEDNKNIIYSPLSIKYALAMLSDAAAGESKEQIVNAAGNLNVGKYTNNDKQSLANAMFVKDEKMEQINESYIQALEQKYNASVISDPFTSEAPLNNWVGNQTFGLINNLFDDSVLNSDFVLVNALAIDMNWNNKLQCTYIGEEESAIPCMHYAIHFLHENYSDYVGYIEGDNFDKITFNDQEVSTAKIGASANNYDIVSELGEDYVRSTVQAAYDEWLAKAQANPNYPTNYDIEFDIDKYIEELNSNYGKTASSTDFYFADTDTEKVFAKDLQENEGSTLQYIGIMPKDEELTTYINGITTDKITSIKNSLNDVSTMDGFEEKVVTKISSNIPFFDFDYKLKLVDDFKTLGITDVFIKEKADLSQMTSIPNSYIQDALHKANISFSNDGIRAAAATALAGGFGAGGPEHFEYEWDVPVKEIDLTFDKPFFFIIQDKTSGEIWFAGAVYNPAE